jgi:hypothetical protein
MCLMILIFDLTNIYPAENNLYVPFRSMFNHYLLNLSISSNLVILQMWEKIVYRRTYFIYQVSLYGITFPIAC